jgi:hypothetical protein
MDVKFIPIGATNLRRLRKYLTPETFPARYRDTAVHVVHAGRKKAMMFLRKFKRAALDFRSTVSMCICSLLIC